MKFATLRRFALGLDSVTEAPHHHFSSFRCSGKIFVTVPPGETHVHVFPTEEDRERALAVYPGCMEKLLWGGKVVGVKVCLAPAPAAAVKALVRGAHAQALSRLRPASQRAGRTTPDDGASPGKG